MIIYHHNDPDGFCSAAIVKVRYPEAQTRDMNYQQKIPTRDVEGRDIFILDFSVPPKQMVRLVKAARSVTWVDHHKTAIEAWNQEDSKVVPQQMKLEIGRAGCELTWELLHPGEKTPEAVRAVGRYDVWDHSVPHHRLFYTGLDLYKINPSDPEAVSLWASLMPPTKPSKSEALYKTIVDQGSIIGKYMDQSNRIAARSMSYIGCFDGFKTVFINRRANSFQFDTVFDRKRHDLMLQYTVDPAGFFRISIYSTKDSVDCGEIAKRYGGGGHSQAAGFTLPLSSEKLFPKRK